MCQKNNDDEKRQREKNGCNTKRGRFPKTMAKLLADQMQEGPRHIQQRRSLVVTFLIELRRGL